MKLLKNETEDGQKQQNNHHGFEIGLSNLEQVDVGPNFAFRETAPTV